MASGFEEDFVNPVDEDFHCLVCHLPLREPVQTKCGHRFCKLCLDQHMERFVSITKANDDFYCSLKSAGLILGKQSFNSFEVISFLENSLIYMSMD